MTQPGSSDAVTQSQSLNPVSHLATCHWLFMISSVCRWRWFSKCLNIVPTKVRRHQPEMNTSVWGFIIIGSAVAPTSQARQVMGTVWSALPGSLYRILTKPDVEDVTIIFHDKGKQVQKGWATLCLKKEEDSCVTQLGSEPRCVWPLAFTTGITVSPWEGGVILWSLLVAAGFEDRIICGAGDQKWGSLIHRRQSAPEQQSLPSVSWPGSGVHLNSKWQLSGKLVSTRQEIGLDVCLADFALGLVSGQQDVAPSAPVHFLLCGWINIFGLWGPRCEIFLRP